MSDQPKALRLADAMTHYFDERGPDAEAVAAELRRLVAENEALKQVIENCKAVSAATAECWRLDQEKFEATTALNAELVEALRFALGWWGDGKWYGAVTPTWVDYAKDAQSKVEASNEPR